MIEHKHRDVKHWPNDDWGTHGTQVEICECGARRQTDPWSGKWSEWAMTPDVTPDARRPLADTDGERE